MYILRLRVNRLHSLGITDENVMADHLIVRYFSLDQTVIAIYMFMPREML